MEHEPGPTVTLNTCWLINTDSQRAGCSKSHRAVQHLQEAAMTVQHDSCCMTLAVQHDSCCMKLAVQRDS
jgi:hypothetical protein